MTDLRMTEPGNPPRKAPDEAEHWLARPATVRTLSTVSVVVLVLLLGADFFVSHYRHFVVGGTFGFYVWYAVVSCVAFLAAAKLLGVFLKRGEAYYASDAEGFPDVSAEGGER